jgi:hypothetical protein
MRWRLAGVGVAALVVSGAAAYLVLPFAVRGVVRALELALSGSVWVAASLSTGADAWTVAGAVGRAAARALLTTRALAIVGALVLVSAAALYGLQRVLGFEEESFR